MVRRLTFETTLELCDALGQYAAARSLAVPDKDLILAAVKIDGRSSLKTVRISEMSAFQRSLRWFGFGNATLSAVAKVLEENEPRLPRCFSTLKQAEMFSHFAKELTKERFKNLRNDKISGCAILLDCLSRHNSRHLSWKVYIHLQESEKIDLCFAESEPLGLLPEELIEGIIQRKYKAPPLDIEQFKYRDPANFKSIKMREANLLGFCYEYGLGVKADLDMALRSYEIAVKAVETPTFAARYNYGRLLLIQRRFQEAVAEFSELKEAISLSAKKIPEIQVSLHESKAKLPRNSKSHLLHLIEARLTQATRKKRLCEKMLERTHLALAKALSG